MRRPPPRRAARRRGGSCAGSFAGSRPGFYPGSWIIAFWAALSSLGAAPAGADADRPFCDVDLSRPDVVAACYVQPTDRYGHGVFGQSPGEPGEWAALTVALRSRLGPDGALSDSAFVALPLPTDRVFEDLVPRLVDLDRDGRTEILTVESGVAEGAQLALYAVADGALVKRAWTAPIGLANRWLAPAAIADFDGDGVDDIAYVDRPHLAGALRLVRWSGDRLVAIETASGRPAAKTGYSNHRYGETAIFGAARDCGQGLEVVVADIRWTRLAALRLGAAGLIERPLALPPTAEGFDAAARCRDD